jgi:hypothetical protein
MVALAGVSLLMACGDRTPTSIAATRAYSVQLHVHGLHSEGVGSIDSHSHEANELGLDVIWWSDHDFRIASYRHVSTFGFEDWSATDSRGESWRDRRERLGRRSKSLQRVVDRSLGAASANFTDDDPYEGVQCFRVDAVGPDPHFRAHLYSFIAGRATHVRPLASRITLEIAIFPVKLGRDARATIEIRLSEHAPREGLPLTTYTLHYYLDNGSSDRFRDGTTFHVPLSYREGEWNRFTLPVTQHVVEGFPFIVGEDNSLNSLLLGVEARHGARASARFDALRILQELSGGAAFARQREVIDLVAADYPGLRQLQGVEISYASWHLNEFSVDTQLLDYDALADQRGIGRDAPPVSDDEAHRTFATRWAVELVHARGGLVSYNHMFGVGLPGAQAVRTREQILDLLLDEKLYGADILEVGYRDRGGHPLADHLWIWDQLALNGIRAVGTGVSDSHGGPGQRWRTGINNFVTWIYAASADKADLIDGLREGRVYFGDLSLFSGKLDLRTPNGVRMGETVSTDRVTEEIAIEIDGLEREDSIHVVESGVHLRTYHSNGSRFRQRHTVSLPADRDAFVRVEVYDASGGAKVFSNPIYFVRGT